MKISNAKLYKSAFADTLIMADIFSGFTKQERNVLRRLNTPIKVQNFLQDNVEYKYGDRHCPQSVLREKVIDCLDAAVFACAALTYHKYNVFLIDLKGFYEEDHVLCVFRMNGLYGAIAMSKFICLKYRNPVYKSIRELVMSYFEGYYSYKGRLVLWAYSVPFYPTKRYGADWLYKDKVVDRLAGDIDEIPHFRLLPSRNIAKIKKSLVHVDPLKFWREIIYLPPQFHVGKRYADFRKKLGRK